MPKYCVNNIAQANGDHEVHKEGCSWWPQKDITDLGIHTNCQTAVIQARLYHHQVNGCKHCSEACHTS